MEGVGGKRQKRKLKEGIEGRRAYWRNCCTRREREKEDTRGKGRGRFGELRQ